MLRRAVVATLLVLGAPAVCGGCGGGDENDADQLSTATELADTWVTGWTEGDPELVASVFTDDALYVSFTGNSPEGREAIAAYVNTMRSRVADVIRVGDVAETDEGAFTWVIEGDLAGDRVSGMLEAELDGDLFSRLIWAEDPAPLE